MGSFDSSSSLYYLQKESAALVMRILPILIIFYSIPYFGLENEAGKGTTAEKFEDETCYYLASRITSPKGISALDVPPEAINQRVSASGACAGN